MASSWHARAILTAAFTSDLERDAEGHIKLAVQPEIDVGDATCDKCGKPMVVKKSRYGMFLACTGYPECKNTRDLKQTSEGTLAVAEATTQHMCDKCGKPLVEKKGRFGPFLGCSGYPECKNIVKLDRSGQPKPPPQITDELCPACGKPMALKQGRYGPFLSCTGYPKCKTIKKLRKSRGASRRLIVTQVRDYRWKNEANIRLVLLCYGRECASVAWVLTQR